MKKNAISVFTYEELSEGAKEKVRGYFCENVLGNDWYDDIYENFKRDAKVKYGLTVDDIQFTGFWSQGDGASFTASIESGEDLKQILRQLGIKVKRGLVSYLYDYMESKVMKRFDFRYCHEHTVYTNITVYSNDTFPYISNYIEGVAEQLEKRLEELRLDMCRWLYLDLREFYERATSDKEIAICYEDMYFMANGGCVGFLE